MSCHAEVATAEDQKAIRVARLTRRRRRGAWSATGGATRRSLDASGQGNQLSIMRIQYSSTSNVYEGMESLTRCPDMADPDIDLTAIVLRERSRLGNFIRRRVRDQIDAEDILQDVLFAFVEAFRLPTSIEHASGWLFQVARNRIIDRFRRRKEERIPEVVGTGMRNVTVGWISSCRPWTQDPEAEYARSALLGALQDALDELPEQSASRVYRTRTRRQEL
jgi:RNA polymerase sigma factor (sigma-70 family)